MFNFAHTLNKFKVKKNGFAYLFDNQKYIISNKTYLFKKIVVGIYIY